MVGCQIVSGCCSVFLEGADWTDFSAQVVDSALPGYLHFHCVLELSNKDYLFHLQLDLEFLFRDNVIYLIRCPCGLAYVGKTSRPLRTRISEHHSNIRTGDMRCPIASHCRQVGHNVSVLQYIGIEKPSRGDYENTFLQRECFWIYTLNTT